MSTQSYKISQRNDDRFVIADSETGAVLDDANGYGYKTSRNAQKAAWYKFKGGKEKLDAKKDRADNFWRKNKAFAKYVEDMFEIEYKAIAYGEINLDEELPNIANEMGVVGFEMYFLEHVRVYK